jgi:hypothetical protein
MHFQIMMKESPTKCIFKVNHIFRISMLLLHVSALQERHRQGDPDEIVRMLRTISSESFGLHEDGAPAVPKHVGATLIF